VPGLINVDFNDVKTIMSNAGSAMMGIGTANGEEGAAAAAEAAVKSPLLDSTISGAKGVLLNITGGPNLSLIDVNEASKIITDAVDPDATIIFGATIDDKMDDAIRVTVIATGIDDGTAGAKGPKPMNFKKPETPQSKLTKSAETAAASKISSFNSPSNEIPPWLRK
jgi:cell division protein FtsZ